jgi:hypothetical protein
MSQEQEIKTEVVLTSVMDILVFLKCGDYLIACRPKLLISMDSGSRNISRLKVIAEPALHPDESSHLINKVNGQA